MDMRNLINLVEGVLMHPGPFGRKFALIENPTTEEIMRLQKALESAPVGKSSAVRAIITHDGSTLWVWDSNEALHSDVAAILKRHDDLYFMIHDRYVDRQKTSQTALRSAMAKNETLRELGIHKLPIRSERKF